MHRSNCSAHTHPPRLPPRAYSACRALSFPAARKPPRRASDLLGVLVILVVLANEHDHRTEAPLLLPTPLPLPRSLAPVLHRLPATRARPRKARQRAYPLAPLYPPEHLRFSLTV